MPAQRTDPEASGPYWGAWTAYIGAMREAGIIVNGDALQGGHTATTVRVRDGARQVQDGPYADTKEVGSREDTAAIVAPP